MSPLRAGLLLALLAVAGCASDREVMVRVPLSRLELPEPSPRTFGIGPASGGEARVLLTPDQTVSAPDPDAPTLSTEQGGSLRFDWQLQDNFGAGIRLYEDDLGSIRFKWIGRRPRKAGERASVAVTAAYGKGEGEFAFEDALPSSDTRDARTEYDQQMLDAAVILGWRLEPKWLLFGGPYYHRTRYIGKHRAGRGSDPDIFGGFSGTTRLLGANVALAWLFADWGQLVVEYSAANVTAGDSGDVLGHAALSAQFFFGQLTDPRPKPPRDPPVIVVPPAESPPAPAAPAEPVV